jgi:taurine dioxygenase
MTLQLKKLSDHMAIAAYGVDLARQAEPETIANLKAALHENLVLCLREQSLGATAFREAMTLFGTPVLRRQITQHPDCAEVNIISSEDRDIHGDGKRLVNGENWHTDDSFMREPCALTMLYGVVVPSVGGDTQFANMYAAFDALSAGFKARIDGMKVVHKYHSTRKGTKAGKRPADEMAAMPDAIHPLVRTHPVTGRKALYMNPNRMDHIVGLPRAESDALIDELAQHATSPQFLYRHKWKQGDIVIWDNRCTMHKANADYPDGERRMMHRVVVAGDVPY